ncbi:dihydrodipicolinate synthase family protein [Natronobacterium gregoryi]|uniref:Dihydrodipicolinate synthase n=2 Tax=Natronobacterium gregoryi TaxID=44930 RepID=L0AJ85_NATGS|nr:dihydrodipicolinate synthase family protein [Natronobacterium gregoryi]AFZ73871.1 dihydrodipicolinate synthase/N-acetylneuraminate lyase [Natronobacterium gregoryi SP2]ELY65031.1 dihydrodipicolinate synthase [Natronobacterium gregoryi SP2]PLK18408.1 dihydrodipicolinate synthase family protein [Natronobacterium gregoryi SP2]SFJ71219.1 4-hydroxy-tetrahydrodipicolinate synthase [Natronobacterium gregoryi]
MTLEHDLQGITTPLVTPFDSDGGEIDESALEDLVDHLLENGIDGLFPCGTTGEFASLTPEERRRVHEVVVDRAEGEVAVLAGAAATTVEEAVDYAEHAAEIGADVAVVTEPYFHGPNAPDGNRRFFERVADRSPLPVLLYNIPPCTGGSIALEALEAVADHENVIGIKDSSGDLGYTLSVIRRMPKEFVVLQGYDALLTPALRMGADGGLNAGSNVAPAAYTELYESFEGERGIELQDAIEPLFGACAEHGFAPATKTALEYRGIVPSDAVRPPLVPVPEDGQAGVAEGVDALLES